MASKRNRKLFSIKDELVNKSREAALSSVQIFNNPQIQFKSELFIVTMCISWTYLLHAYFRKRKIDYRYSKVINRRRKFDKTKGGADKHWELERCLDEEHCPLDQNTKNNLRFLIGIRHEIEHQMTTRIDDTLSAKFQACCLNYNHYIKKLFGSDKGIDRYLSFSLQFAAIEEPQKEVLDAFKDDLPVNISSFVTKFESSLSEDEYKSPQFGYRVLFVPKTAARKGQADRVIEFVKADSSLAAEANRVYIKETEKAKYLPSQIVEEMRSKGFSKFSMHNHSMLWKKSKAKDKSKGYGVGIAKTWYWYQSWYEVVLNHCESSGSKYK